jgi:mono/diheme cytochrome c family protein
MSWNRSTVSLLALLTVASASALFTELRAAHAQAPVAKAAPNKAEQLKRGEYLVTIGGCHDCHTPMKMTPFGPMPDFTRSLSGHPPNAPEPTGTPGKTDMALTGSDLTSWRMPYGVVYSRNITPDKSGIGDWTEAQFIKTLRVGRHQGEGRPILAPMPWPNAAAMTDEDLKAVYAYLKSIKPINNPVPDPKVPPAVIEQFVKTNEAIVAMLKAGPPPSPAPAPAAPAPTKPK